MDLNMINGVIRAILPAILAFVAGKGWIAQGDVGDITAAVLAIAAAAWSVHTNKPSSVISQAADNPSVDKITVTDPVLAELPSPKVVEK